MRGIVADRAQPGERTTLMAISSVSTRPPSRLDNALTMAMWWSLPTTGMSILVGMSDMAPRAKAMTIGGIVAFGALLCGGLAFGGGGDDARAGAEAVSGD